jgi:hypothetical protein
MASVSCEWKASWAVLCLLEQSCVDEAALKFEKEEFLGALAALMTTVVIGDL